MSDMLDMWIYLINSHREKENKMNKFESGCYYKRTKNTKASQENIAYYKCVYTNDTQALLEFYNEDDKLVTTGLVPLEAEYFEKIEKPKKEVKVGQIFEIKGYHYYVLAVNGKNAKYLYIDRFDKSVGVSSYTGGRALGTYIETLNNSQEFFDKYVF